MTAKGTPSRRRWCVCACCGLEGWHAARGWRHACYQRWVYAGQPAGGPPAKGAAADRVEDYAELRSWGLTRQAAADRLGLSIRTLQRYDQRLKAGVS